MAHFTPFLFLVSAAFCVDPTGTRPLRPLYLDQALASVAHIRSRGFPHASSSNPSSIPRDQTWLARIEADALLVHAEMALSRSQWEQCDQFLNSCIKITAHDQPALWSDYQLSVTLLRGMLYQGVAQLDKALDCYSTVLLLQPRHPLALVSISLIRLGRGEGLAVTSTPAKKAFSKSKDLKLPKELKLMPWMSMPIEQLVSEARACCDAAKVPRLKVAAQLLIGITRTGIVKSK